MVEIHDSIQPPPALSYVIEEQFLRAKTGDEEDNEDAIYIGPHFLAVIDGATSKSRRRFNGKTGGKMAALLLREAFSLLTPDATIREAVDHLTSTIKRFYKRHKIYDVLQAKPSQRATASFVALSLARSEIWMVGDCQCLLNQELVTNTKIVDQINAHARSLYLESELCKGKTIEALQSEDTGREYILPLLKRQMFFQNNPLAGQYFYAVLDGFNVPEEGLRIINLPPEMQTVIMASDGYPFLKDSLQTSEETLQEVLREDPLLFRRYKSTKGVKAGNASFDDRAYLKVRLRIES